MPQAEQTQSRHGLTVLVTGAAGYVGAMLIDQWRDRDDIACIIGIDKEPQPALLSDVDRLVWVTANTADETWQETARQHAPDVVVHAAWQIREMYGKQWQQWQWNVAGSDAVFTFAMQDPSVKKLVYFSTASVYGAEADNTIEDRFTEVSPLREAEYRYGWEKRQTEERLQERFGNAGADRAAVYVLRPAAITGPRGRYMRTRFGLQAVLAGQMRDAKALSYRVVSTLVSFIPAPPKWCRQFIHEDDVTDIVTTAAFDAPAEGYHVYNIVPPGPVVRARDMARAVGKRVMPMPPWLVRCAFFCFWHATRGKIPTSRGGWKFYSYPVVLDGSKLSTELGYTYQYGPHEAFVSTAGRYEYAVPEEQRRRLQDVQE